MKLFYEVISCKKCLYSWEGLAHGFSRGHSVLKKENDIIFIPDDLGYFFPKSAHLDFEKEIKEKGWKDLESCPKCGSKDLFPLKYDHDSMKDIECILLEKDDFEVIENEVRLSPNGLNKIDANKAVERNAEPLRSQHPSH